MVRLAARQNAIAAAAPGLAEAAVRLRTYCRELGFNTGALVYFEAHYSIHLSYLPAPFRAVTGYLDTPRGALPFSTMRGAAIQQLRVFGGAQGWQLVWSEGQPAALLGEYLATMPYCSYDLAASVELLDRAAALPEKRRGDELQPLELLLKYGRALTSEQLRVANWQLDGLLGGAPTEWLES